MNWIPRTALVAKDRESFLGPPDAGRPDAEISKLHADDLAIRGIVVHHQNSQTIRIWQRFDWRRGGLLLEHEREPKGGPFAGLALNADLSAQCFDNLAADTKAEAGSSVFPGVGIVRLDERI